MSNVLAALRRAGGLMHPALRPWRLVVMVAAVIAVAAASAVHLHSSGNGNGTALAGSGTSGQNGTASGNGAQAGSGNGGSPGNGGAAANGGNASGGAGSSGQAGGAHATATPKAAPTRTPSDSVFGHADVLQSNCGAGYEPGTQCSVYEHGTYELITHPAATLVMQTVIDGTVAATMTYPAPAGGHRFGGTLKFTVPPHAKEIVYKVMLEDATGNVLVSSPDQVTAGYG